VDGVPRALPVAPVRGQMVSFAAAALRHVTYGPGGYVLPRASATIAGSTMERVGFESGTTAEGVGAIVAAARAICPALGEAPVREAWSGLRPVTPDLLPIIGRDPDFPALLYACGHSRNGILLAPLTAHVIAALAAGEDPRHDLAPFSVARFAERREPMADG
jgi:glycine oxidase